MDRTKLKRAWYTNLYTLPIVISLIGLYFVFEASSVRALNVYDDPYYFLKRQALWLVLGIISMVVFSRLDYKRLNITALPMILLSMVFLVAVLIPGIGTKTNGARRWIDLGPFGFQPSEMVKLTVILYLAAWFQHREKHRIVAFSALLLILAGLTMLQPDMGTAILIVMLSVGMYFVAGVQLRQLLWLIPAFALAALVTAQSASYRLNRLRVLFDVDSDPTGIGYHTRQAMIALQNGGFLGLGFGGSKQKYLFLPEAHTDSIFAIIVEEMGFLGGMGLILLYSLFIYYIYRVIVQTKDRFGFMLSSGVLIFFGLQSILNLAAMTRLAPLTGVPLPFISSGGTNLLVSYTLVGIVLNIARRMQEPYVAPRKKMSKVKS